MNCNLSPGSFGIPYNRNGEIVFYTISEAQLTQILCHGLSAHGVTPDGGFYGGRNSEVLGQGVALGKDAKVIPSSEGMTLDAMQFGSGTNTENGTVKFWNWQLLTALGKINEERLPAYKVEFRIESDKLEWRYIGTSVWYELLDISLLAGQDGVAFKVDEWGNLTEAKLAEIQNNVATGRYVYVVNPLNVLLNTGDLRVDQSVPVSLDGDMSGHIIVFDGDEQAWYDYGPWVGLKGDTGDSIELRNNGVYIQWKVTSDASWINLLPIADLKGPKGDDGITPIIQKTATHIQYSKDEGITWIDIVALSELVGPGGLPGIPGKQVELRVSGTLLQWRYLNEGEWISIFNFGGAVDGSKWESDNATKIGYGYLYNWYAIEESTSNGGFITGFTTPTASQWNELFTLLGGESNAVTALATNRIYPTIPPAYYEFGTPGLDTYKMSILPAGYRTAGDGFDSIERRTWIATSTSVDVTLCNFVEFRTDGGTGVYTTFKNRGFTNRVIRTLSPSELLLIDGTKLANVTDYDGNIYEVIKLGNYGWTAQNIATTHYANGTIITNVTDNTNWFSLTTGAYCIYNNDSDLPGLYYTDEFIKAGIKPKDNEYVDAKHIRNLPTSTIVVDASIIPNSINPVQSTVIQDNFLQHKQIITPPDITYLSLGSEWMHPETLTVYKVYNNNGVKTWVEAGFGYGYTPEVKSIEVILTQAVFEVDINVSELNIREGDVFTISSKVIFLDTLNQPGSSRVRINFNNITTIDYFTTSQQALLTGDGANSYLHNQLVTGTIIDGDIQGHLSHNRLTNTSAITQTSVGYVLRNNNIQQLNSVLFTRNADLFGVGSKFVITKLT